MRRTHDVFIVSRLAPDRTNPLKQGVDKWRGGTSSQQDEQSENQQDHNDRDQEVFLVVAQHLKEFRDQAGLAFLVGFFKGIFGLFTHNKILKLAVITFRV